MSELFYNGKKGKLNEIKIYETEYRHGVSRRYSCFYKNEIIEIGFHKNGNMNEQNHKEALDLDYEKFGEIIRFGKESRRTIANFCNMIESFHRRIFIQRLSGVGIGTEEQIFQFFMK